MSGKHFAKKEALIPSLRKCTERVGTISGGTDPLHVFTLIMRPVGRYPCQGELHMECVSVIEAQRGAT